MHVLMLDARHELRLILARLPVLGCVPIAVMATFIYGPTQHGTREERDAQSTA